MSGSKTAAAIRNTSSSAAPITRPAKPTMPGRGLKGWSPGSGRSLPKLGNVTHRWSGQILDPVDYAAFSGRNPGNEHVFVHTGDSGQGSPTASREAFCCRASSPARNVRGRNSTIHPG